MMQHVAVPSNATTRTFRVRFGKRLPRPMPTCLQNIWTCNEWQDFCDAYDKIVLEEYQLVRVAYALLVAGVLLGALLVLLAAGSAGLFMGGTVIFFSITMTLVYMAWMQRLVISRLGSLCEASSVKHGKLIHFQVNQDNTRIADPSACHPGQVSSFTIREHYLKIRRKTTNGGSLPSLPTDPSGDSNPSRTSSIFRDVEVATDKERTLSERLHALDQLKAVLSTEEYDGKREEILGSVSSRAY